MSHFTVLVIGDSVDEALQPYNEEISVAPYSIGIISEESKQKMLDFYKGKGFEFKSFESCVKEKGESWNGGRYVKLPNGEWHEMSTYNPNSKWDWYLTGGRWKRMLKTKDGDMDAARKKDITNLSELKPFAVVKNGIWYERGEMGWWAIVSNEKSEDEWSNIVKFLLDDAGDDELFTIVDCHI